MVAHKEIEFRHLRYTEGATCPTCAETSVTQIALIDPERPIVIERFCGSRRCNSDASGTIGHLRRLTRGVYLSDEPFIAIQEELCEVCGMETDLQFFRNGALIASECLNERCALVRIPSMRAIIPELKVTATEVFLDDADVVLDAEQETV